MKVPPPFFFANWLRTAPLCGFCRPILRIFFVSFLRQIGRFLCGPRATQSRRSAPLVSKGFILVRLETSLGRLNSFQCEARARASGSERPSGETEARQKSF